MDNRRGNNRRLVARQLSVYQRQLLDALDQNAACIYYLHALEEHRWLAYEDRAAYHGELRSIRRQLREGIHITEVVAAEETFDMPNGISLHVMLLRCDEPCDAFFLLRQRGRFEDRDWTPYFFRTARARDDAVRYINTPV